MLLNHKVKQTGMTCGFLLGYIVWVLKCFEGNKNNN